MIKAVVGSGGKTTLIHQLAKQYRKAGKKVFVTTTTKMLIEEDTLLSSDANEIIMKLNHEGYVMAGTPVGKKIIPLSSETYEAVCQHADVVLIEADGSRCLPLKYPNEKEPVIPHNVDEIIVVCGLNALGQKANKVCHRLELVKACLKIEDETIIQPQHIQTLVYEAYLKPLRQKYPHKQITLSPRDDGSLYQRCISALLKAEKDVSLVQKGWFTPQPHMLICGGGHVAREVARLATHLDFQVKVLDSRQELVSKERFPHVQQVICDSYQNLESYMEPNAYYVVVTPNHAADYLCVEKIIQTQYAYLGMIGSKRKVATTFEKLRQNGISEDKIATIFSPIGLAIGAITPAEIAISIMAQIIQEKNRSHAASADRDLLAVQEKGVLCIVIDKHGSAPRGIGSMMFVGSQILGSIGGGESEYLAICDARKVQTIQTKTYVLNTNTRKGLDMVCGGTIKVLFIPIDERSKD